MRELIVSLERNGTLIPIGTITGNDPQDTVFTYDETYLHDHRAAAISISLPLQAEPFSPLQTSCYFEGLLPEGFTRRTVAQWLQVDEGDYLSILHGLGKECLGAVCIAEAGERPRASYERLSTERVSELAAEGATKSAELVTKTHLSLTGASGKVGLYYDSKQDTWYLPWGTAPSTHIVKQSHIRLDSIVTNECLCLLTAAHCGIDVPHSFIINTGAGADSEVLFATERYDRKFPEDALLIDGLPRPLRLHQEDFAQAMGISAFAKYEREGSHYLQRMFDVVRVYSSGPIVDQLKLWDILVFDWLIGNTDAHVKNFSLLYDANLQGIRLAPAYDIVSTTVYEQSTRDMALRIGGVCSIDEITDENFRMAAHEAGIAERMAMNRYEDMCNRFTAALHQSAEELADAGYSAAIELERRILDSGGIRNV